jgi:hypothetical protein
LGISYVDAVLGWKPSSDVVNPTVDLLVTGAKDAPTYAATATAMIPSGWAVRIVRVENNRRQIDALFNEVKVALNDPTAKNSMRALFDSLTANGFELGEIVRSPWLPFLDVGLTPKTFVPERDASKLGELVNAAGLTGKVKFSLGERRTVAQATWDTRVVNGNWTRGGKQINSGGCTTGPTLRTTTGPPRFFVASAGHCFNSQVTPTSTLTVNIAGRTGTVLGSTLCYGAFSTPSCNVNQDADSVLIETGPSTSYQFITEAHGSYACTAPAVSSCTANQGQTYLDNQINTNDGWWYMSPCLEGASLNKYGSNFWMHDAGTVCGLRYGESADGYAVFHLYDYGVACRGDSGGLIRTPLAGGGSTVNGLFHAMVGVQSANPVCLQRPSGSVTQPAQLFYTKVGRVLAWSQARLGVNLEILHP